MFRLLPYLERGLVPRAVVRAEFKRRLARRLEELGRWDIQVAHERKVEFIASSKSEPLTQSRRDVPASVQELPVSFYELVLGPRLKYSPGYFATGLESLADAEEAMLEMMIERAQLADGQRLLELGCGWGSLTLAAAERFPNVRITAVSHSTSQREYIMGRAKLRGLENVQVLTRDAASFDPDGREFGGRFDRVLCGEIFDRIKNPALLMERIARWLASDGLAFLQHAAHASLCCPEPTAPSDADEVLGFIAGDGIPSADLLTSCQDRLRRKREWRLDGRHFARTATCWLRRHDEHRGEIERIFTAMHGHAAEGRRQWAMWSLYFLGAEELFGFANGQEWIVSQGLFGK